MLPCILRQYTCSCAALRSCRSAVLALTAGIRSLALHGGWSLNAFGCLARGFHDGRRRETASAVQSFFLTPSSDFWVIGHIFLGSFHETECSLKKCVIFGWKDWSARVRWVHQTGTGALSGEYGWARICVCGWVLRKRAKMERS